MNRDIHTVYQPLKNDFNVFLENVGICKVSAFAMEPSENILNANINIILYIEHIITKDLHEITIPVSILKTLSVEF